MAGEQTDAQTDRPAGWLAGWWRAGLAGWRKPETQRQQREAAVEAKRARDRKASKQASEQQ